MIRFTVRNKSAVLDGFSVFILEKETETSSEGCRYHVTPSATYVSASYLEGYIYCLYIPDGKNKIHDTITTVFYLADNRKVYCNNYLYDGLPLGPV